MTRSPSKTQNWEKEAVLEQKPPGYTKYMQPYNILLNLQAASVTEKGTARSGHPTDIRTVWESAYLTSVINTRVMQTTKLIVLRIKACSTI